MKKKITLILLTVAILLGVLAYCQKQKTTVSDNAEEIVEEQNKEETIEEALDVILDVEADDYLFLVKSDNKLSLKTPKGDPIEIDGHIHFDKTGEYGVRVKYVDSTGQPFSAEKTIFVGTDAEIQDQKKKLEEEKASENQESNTGANTNTNKPVVTNTGSNGRSGSNTGNSGNTGSNNGGGSGNTGNNGGEKPKEKNCHYVDERYVVKEGYYENILVKEAWTETSNFCTAYGQDSRDVFVCWTCGYRCYDRGEFENHRLSSNGQCGSFYVDQEYYGDVHCLSYETTTINHPAEYKQVWHEPEYGTRQVQVCD